MTIPSTLESLSTTIGSNVPAEGDGTLMTSVNDGFRAAYGFIRQVVSAGSDIASASTITPPSNGSSFNITGTTTITAIASTNSWNGRTICLRFEGAIQLTHSSSLVLPASANITAASGDYALFRQYSSGVWHCVSYLPFSGIPLVKGSTSASFVRGDGTASSTLGGSFTVNAAVGAKIEIQDSGDSNRGGYMTTTASTFLISSNSAVRTTVLGYDGTAVLTIDTNRRVNISAPGTGTNPLTANSNSSSNTWISHINSDITGNCGFQASLTGGVVVDVVAVQSDHAQIGTSTNHDLRFKVNNSVVGAFDTNGAFSIGSVFVSGSEKQLVKQSSGATNSAQVLWNSATTGDNQFALFGTEATYTTRGSITYNRAGGLVAYNTTSDYRAKDVLGPVIDSGSVIDSLKIHMGRMKGATIARPMLVAHEAKLVAPYSVTGDKDETDAFGRPLLQQIDHQSFIPLILAEIQDIRKRLDVLEAKGPKVPSPAPAPSGPIA